MNCTQNPLQAVPWEIVGTKINFLPSERKQGKKKKAWRFVFFRGVGGSLLLLGFVCLVVYFFFSEKVSELKI